MKKQKILFLAPGVVPFFEGFTNEQKVGGAELQQYMLINGLANEGHEVYVMIDKKKSNIQNFKNISFIHYPVENRYLKYVQVFNQLLKYFPDIIYLRSPSNMGIVPAIYGKIFNKRVIFASAHDSDFDVHKTVTSFNKKLFRVFLGSVKSVFVQNKVQLELLKNNYAIDGMIVRNVVKTISEQEFESIRKDGDYYLWVGRVVSFKRLELLVEIATKMPDEKFVVVGPHDINSEYVKDLLPLLHKTANIQFVPFADRLEIVEYYKNSKGLINTSSQEGFSNTFLEAWNYGKPVFTLGVDPDGIIDNSEGKLGEVYQDSKESIDKIVIFSTFEKKHAMNYLHFNHSLENYLKQILKKERI